MDAGAKDAADKSHGTYLTIFCAGLREKWEKRDSSLSVSSKQGFAGRDEKVNVQQALQSLSSGAYSSGARAIA